MYIMAAGVRTTEAVVPMTAAIVTADMELVPVTEPMTSLQNVIAKDHVPKRIIRDLVVAVMTNVQIAGPIVAKQFV